MSYYILVLIVITVLIYLVNQYEIIRYISINFNPSFNMKYRSLKRVNKRDKCIISFTTTPARIQNSKFTISSLLSQTRRVDEIRLYIPTKTHKGEIYVIPKWMERLQKNLPIFK